jgi:hypothetical protein
MPGHSHGLSTIKHRPGFSQVSTTLPNHPHIRPLRLIPRPIRPLNNPKSPPLIKRNRRLILRKRPKLKPRPRPLRHLQQPRPHTHPLKLRRNIKLIHPATRKSNEPRRLPLNLANPNLILRQHPPTQKPPILLRIMNLHHKRQPPSPSLAKHPHQPRHQSRILPRLIRRNTPNDHHQSPQKFPIAYRAKNVSESESPSFRWHGRLAHVLPRLTLNESSESLHKRKVRPQAHCSHSTERPVNAYQRTPTSL